VLTSLDLACGSRRAEQGCLNLAERWSAPLKARYPRPTPHLHILTSQCIIIVRRYYDLGSLQQVDTVARILTRFAAVASLALCLNVSNMTNTTNNNNHYQLVNNRGLRWVFPNESPVRTTPSYFMESLPTSKQKTYHGCSRLDLLSVPIT
jgi:hypothetical protein